MARKSRKTTVAEPAVIKAVDKVYRAGLYARISVETERKREADTIGNQLQLLKDYVSEHSDLTVFDIYSDDDISGTDFIRPEFSRMMNDLRDGKIDCIIVKDLSRLGRNYLESGEYIEMVFPFFRCRFISVTDRFDTKYQQADISVQLKNIANLDGILGGIPVLGPVLNGTVRLLIGNITVTVPVNLPLLGTDNLMLSGSWSTPPVQY